ncbi:MAG: carbohydrate binding family 9 domain-containing protein [Gemmatimonadota bacterium]|nr:carbohydrate binding family 9 domain-containing protein [Gemmatimonadota bacterium]
MQRSVRIAGGVLGLVLSSGGATAMRAQSDSASPRPAVSAVRLVGQIVLDGRLSEDVWRTTPAATDFRQSEPNEGTPATQRTELRFAYDGDALYVGARMFDTEGAAGVRTRLVRRDGSPNSDFLEIIFDTFHDHLGRTFFRVNPAGSRGDAIAPGGSGEDESWDPVWEAKTRIDSLGWTAELRIPFSQLRYVPADVQSWGLQVWRFESRLNEWSMWAFWRRNEVGGPPMFGHLTDLSVTRPPERVELLPYVVGRSVNLPPGNPDDPFADQHAFDGRVGADAKALLTSNLTLSATINPDFGQVEVDPAVVNLSAFETYFEERRPFFIEGAGLFSFGGMSCFFCSNVSSLSMFYTRRIGRQPQASSLAYNEGPYADIPDNTEILGAAKLTGRNGSGWSLGILDAVTRRERATVQRDDSSRTTVTVEPLTNYFVGRVAKDLRGGLTQIRGMATSVVRDLESPGLAGQLSRHAEAVGFSTDTWFGEREYRLMAQAAMTQVAGDSGAILRLQRSSARYFQRPDRGQGTNGLFTDRYDPSLTTMRGWGLYSRFSRESGNWLGEVAVNARSPGFENNDIAFLTRADYAWMNANVARVFTHPGRWFREMVYIAGGQQQYNFDGDLTDRQVQVFGDITFPNYWDFRTFWIHRFTVLDDRLTRGGPVVGRAGLNYFEAGVTTDERKTVVLEVGTNFGCTFEDACFTEVGLDVRWRPASNVTLSFEPAYAYSGARAQYVTTVADPTATAFAGARYVFSDLVQREVSMETRLAITFTPNLTLELFLQPFISSGAYTDFKEFAVPRQLDKLVYGRDVGTVTVRGGEPPVYEIDPDGGGPAEPFEIEDPSFTVRSLRGNAVLRWEYLPGSTLFLVWTQSREDALNTGELDFGRDARAVFRGPAENIFLVKVNYWFGF